MTTARWQCPKCGHHYPWHPSNTHATHRCNPQIPRVTVLVLVDETPARPETDTTPSTTIGRHTVKAGAPLAKAPGVTGPKQEAQ